MTDSLMFQENEYVVLSSDQPEEIITAAEMLVKLSETLLNHGEIDFPADVLAKSSTAARAAYLLDNYCELDLGEGRYIQWYAVRLEKN
jgi:Protein CHLORORESPIRATORY REDUCTION 7